MKKEMRRSGSQVNYTQRNYAQASYHKEAYTNNRKQYTNLSSNYYMPTANAVAHDYQYEEDPQKAVQKAHKNGAKKRSSLAQYIPTLLVVFLLGFVLVTQYAYIQNLGYQVTQSKEELKTVQEQNEKLKKQITALGELQTVESIAINNMGMRKPTANEIIYLSAEPAVAAEQPATNTVDETVDKVKSVIGTIMR